MLEWEGGCAKPILFEHGGFRQSPGLVSELVQRSLLLPTWLLKNWGSALINRWSPKKPDTLLPISTHKNHKLVMYIAKQLLFAKEQEHAKQLHFGSWDSSHPPWQLEMPKSCFKP